MKKLTAKQKERCDKIINLLKELKNENITMVIEASPNLEIGFIRDLKNMELEEYLDFINSNANTKYQPEMAHNNFKLEMYGF